MNIKLFEPSDLTKCQTVVATNRLNYALPMYPNGTMESSKNTSMEVIGLMEWSLPYERRTKFDTDYSQ